MRYEVIAGVRRREVFEQEKIMSDVFTFAILTFLYQKNTKNKKCISLPKLCQEKHMRNDSQLGLKHVGDASMPCPPHFHSSTRGPQRGVKRNRKRDVVNTRQNTIKM